MLWDGQFAPAKTGQNERFFHKDDLPEREPDPLGGVPDGNVDAVIGISVIESEIVSEFINFQCSLATGNRDGLFRPLR